MILHVHCFFIIKCVFVCVGGAPVEDVRALASSNITMDISTFRSLSIPVVTVTHALSLSHTRLCSSRFGCECDCTACVSGSERV